MIRPVDKGNIIISLADWFSRTTGDSIVWRLTYYAGFHETMYTRVPKVIFDKKTPSTPYDKYKQDTQITCILLLCTHHVKLCLVLINFKDKIWIVWLSFFTNWQNLIYTSHVDEGKESYTWLIIWYRNHSRTIYWSEFTESLHLLR